MGYKATQIITNLVGRVNGLEGETARRRSRENKLWLLLIFSSMLMYSCFSWLSSEMNLACIWNCDCWYCKPQFSHFLNII